MSQDRRRQPIQLREKSKFDEAHQEIAPDKSQGEFVSLLIEEYRKAHQKVQV